MSYPRQFLKYVMTGIESYAAHCSSNICFVYDENVNKIDFFCVILYCGSSTRVRENAGRRKKSKELQEP